MYCTCNERNQWILNDRNLSLSTNTLPRKSHETLVGKKSALKSTSANRSSTTPKKTVKTVDSRLGPRFSTLPRSRSRARPHVATIFNEQHQRARRQSEVIPWHQPSSAAQQCTCRSSCYFCNLNYPKVPPQLSASTNALGYYYPYSTLSLNNPNYCQQPQTQFTNSSQYLFNNQPQLQQKQQQQGYPQFPINSHHHSMINLNHNYNSVTSKSNTDNPIKENNLEPLLNENSSSPTMSNSPVPEPPAPPLNPHCARCRFTSSISATVVASNGTLHRHAVGNSNPHLHQASNANFVASSAGSAAFTSKSKKKFLLPPFWNVLI